MFGCIVASGKEDNFIFEQGHRYSGSCPCDTLSKLSLKYNEHRLVSELLLLLGVTKKSDARGFDTMGPLWAIQTRLCHLSDGPVDVSGEFL